MSSFRRIFLKSIVNKEDKPETGVALIYGLDLMHSIVGQGALCELYQKCFHVPMLVRDCQMFSIYTEIQGIRFVFRALLCLIIQSNQVASSVMDFICWLLNSLHHRKENILDILMPASRRRR